jgi:hypothetical protein
VKGPTGRSVPARECRDRCAALTQRARHVRRSKKVDLEGGQRVDVCRDDIGALRSKGDTSCCPPGVLGPVAARRPFMSPAGARSSWVPGMAARTETAEMSKDLSPVAQREKLGGSRAPARLLAAERQRLARHRRAAKLVCVIVELRHSEIQALICQGRLKSSECADRAAIRRALHSFLDVYLG